MGNARANDEKPVVFSARLPRPWHCPTHNNIDRQKIHLHRTFSRRISLVVNSSHHSRMSNNPQTPPRSVKSWIIALILCCLPGISLVDATMAALAAENSLPASAAPLNLEHTPNTQVAVGSRDSALTSIQRLLSQAKRGGGTYLTTPTDNADPFDSPAAVAPHAPTCDLRPAVRGQGYDLGDLCLAIPPAHAPYSPRSPPVLA